MHHPQLVHFLSHLQKLLQNALNKLHAQRLLGVVEQLVEGDAADAFDHCDDFVVRFDHIDELSRTLERFQTAQDPEF